MILRVTLIARLSAIMERSILVKLMFVCLAGILIAAAVMTLSEPAESAYGSYGSTLVNILILFTSGFDVEQPVSWPGKAAAFLCLMLGICFLGLFTGEVAAWLVERRLKGGQGMSSVKCKNHIIISRWSKETEEIIGELLSPDIENKHRDIVVIERSLPEIPCEHPRVFFVKGDPTEEAVLLRAGVDRCHTAIILSDATAEDYNVEDSRNILITLAIESINNDVYTCVQILNPGNKKHLKRADADEVICTTEISTKVVVQSAVNHGLSNVLSDLLSFGDGSEIYRVKLGSAWEGKDYTDLLVDLRKDHMATLLALESNSKIHINPVSDVAVKSGDHVFVLAEDFPEKLAK